MTIRYPTEPEPYIWLQEGEDEGTADCGCHLAMDNGAKLNFCTMHAAAEEMLEALAKELLSPRSEAWRMLAQRILRKARGGKA